MRERDELLELISSWDEIKKEGCAHNIRENGKSVERMSSEHIRIEPKADGSGLDIHIAPGTRGEKVAIRSPSQRHPPFLHGKKQQSCI